MSKTNLCVTCGKRLPLTEFSIRGNKITLHYTCIRCRKKANKLLYKKVGKAYYQKNREHKITYQKEYREKNIECRKEYEKNYQKIHRGIRNQYFKEYYRNKKMKNKEK